MKLNEISFDIDFELLEIKNKQQLSKRSSTPVELYAVCVIEEAIDQKRTSVLKYDTELDILHNFQTWSVDDVYVKLSKCFIVNNELIILLHHSRSPHAYIMRFLNLDTGEIRESPKIVCRQIEPSIDYYNNELYFIGGTRHCPRGMQMPFAEK